MSDFLDHEAEGSDDDSLSSASGEHPVSKRARVDDQELGNQGEDGVQEGGEEAPAEAEPEAAEEGEIASSEEDDEDSEEEEDEEEGVIFW